MADSARTTVRFFIMHHAVTPLWDEKSKKWLAQWFSDTGFARGYGSNPARWSGLTNPYTGGRSYAMAHYAGQRVTSRTPDATDAERAAGYRLVKLVNDPLGQITWGAGNWSINQGAINVENLGDYRSVKLRDGDIRVLAAYWRPKDVKLGGKSFIYGHTEVTDTGTVCPASILQSRDKIVAYVNNPPKPVEAPKPAPTPTPAPAPAPVNRFERLSTPLNLIVNKSPTMAYDLSQTTWDGLKNAVVKRIPQNDPFVAVGKYNHPLGGVYFMTEYSFGDADKTGKPDHMYGVNTVDLSPAPVVDPVKPTEPDDGAVDIPVNVIPSDPDKWKKTYVEAPNDYIARLDVVVTDLEHKLPDIKLVQRMEVAVAGHFEKDGVNYYRTKTSVANDRWYGIPFTVQDVPTLLEIDELFDLQDFAGFGFNIDNLTLKEKIIKALASLFGWFGSLGKKKE